MTRTFGKVGFIEQRWYDTDEAAFPEARPQHDEWWMVNILREIKPGAPGGMLILRPVKKVQLKDTENLYPGLYDEQLIQSNLYIYPKHTDVLWILPVAMRETFLLKYPAITSIITVL